MGVIEYLEPFKRAWSHRGDHSNPHSLEREEIIRVHGAY